MNEVVALRGKARTGNTSIGACFAVRAQCMVLADCNVTSISFSEQQSKKKNSGAGRSPLLTERSVQNGAYVRKYVALMQCKVTWLILFPMKVVASATKSGRLRL